MHKRNIIAVSILALGISVASFNSLARDQGVFSSVQVGSLGAGLNLGYQFNDYFDMRANINGFNYNHNFDVNSVKYDAHIHSFTSGLLADYYPFGNGFRLTAGAYYNKNKVSGNGYSEKTYYGLDPNDYGYEKATISYKKFAPYVGFGYQSQSDSNWFVTADIGVLYQGKAHVDNSTVCYDGMICSLLSDKIDEENDAQRGKLQDKADRFKFYPVASIGIGYRF